MENQIQVFNEQEVLGKNFRVYGTVEEPLFLAKDVAEWIEYSRRADGSYQVGQMLKSVDEDEKLMLKVLTAGQNREMWFLTENGLYEVLMQSTKPVAKQFKKETKRVLKELRTQGVSMTVQKAEEILTSPETIIQLAQQIIDERNAKLEALKVIEAKNKEIEIMKPKSEYCDMVLKSTNAVTITTIAKDYGMSAIKMNKLLAEMKIQYKQGKTWFLYSQYQDKGYTKSHTTYFEKENGEIGTSVNTQWTQKGRLFLYEKLKTKGILPVCEIDNEMENEA